MTIGWPGVSPTLVGGHLMNWLLLKSKFNTWASQAESNTVVDELNWTCSADHGLCGLSLMSGTQYASLYMHYSHQGITLSNFHNCAGLETTSLCVRPGVKSSFKQCAALDSLPHCFCPDLAEVAVNNVHCRIGTSFTELCSPCLLNLDKSNQHEQMNKWCCYELWV